MLHSCRQKWRDAQMKVKEKEVSIDPKYYRSMKNVEGFALLITCKT